MGKNQVILKELYFASSPQIKKHIYKYFGLRDKAP